MKTFMFTVLALCAAHAAPAQDAARDKRGIYGEPGGLLTPHLHHSTLLGSHLHVPLSASFSAPLAAPLSAPLRAPLRAPLLSSSTLHHHDVHDHALLHELHDSHHHPHVITTSYAHVPVLHHDFHHDIHHDVHHDIHHAPLVLPHHHVAPVVRVVNTLPARHIIRSGW